MIKGGVLMKSFSKSKYCSFRQCPKLAWLNQYRLEERVEDENPDAHMEAGQEVGKLARELFGPSVDVTSYVNQQLDISIMLEKTKQEMKKDTPVICEATFFYEGCYCAVDILKKTEDGWAIYEVKSSTAMVDMEEVEPVYTTDIAYQKYVLEHCGVSVTGTYLVNINSDYVREGELNLQKLFCIRDVFNLVEEELKEVEKNLKEAQEILSNPEEPFCDLGVRCNSPYPCTYWNYCTKYMPKESVFDLYRLSFKKKLEYYRQGMITYQDLEKSGVIKNPKQKRQISFVLEEKGTYVERGNIRAFLEQLSYPLYFLDFETMQPVIPLFEGTKPYQQIPFQYSLHYIEVKGGPLQHKEFLAESGTNPLREIAEALCRDIPMEVCVTAYNKAFECTRLKELAKMFPDLKGHLLNIEEHIVDLLVPFQSGYYYNRAMGGSFSIKSVLPAIFPNDSELDYHSLEGVHNGTEAMALFPKIKDMSKAKQKKARKNLLKYCELDTYAIVKIWEELCEVSFDLENRISKEVESFVKTIRGDFKIYFVEDKDKSTLGDLINNKDKDMGREVIVNALYSGYLDACRTITWGQAGNRYATDNQKKEVIKKIFEFNGKEEEEEKNWSTVDYILECLENNSQDKDTFDKYHSIMCQKLIAGFAEENITITYGHAQKIINMAFKYLYCLDTNNEYRACFRYCHMPLDSFSLEWINRCYIKEENLKDYKDYFDDSVWNQNALKKEEPVYYMKQSEKGPIDFWSKLEYGKEGKNKKCTYKFYVDLLHAKLGEGRFPLWVDFYVWPRMQKILAAEAFIKAFEADPKVYGSCKISKLDETLDNLLKEVVHIVSEEN